VLQEVQSRFREYSTNLQVGREVVEVLQITCDQLTLEKEEEKKHAKNLEKGLTTIYNNISECAQDLEDTSEGKFRRIALLMERYQHEITELTKKLTPTTPLKF
jgi:hypothetical protein